VVRANGTAIASRTVGAQARARPEDDVSISYDDRAVEELLVECRRTGDRRLQEQVVEQMRPLVRSVARKFAGRAPVEDLESEGYLGLLRAVERFQPERGARFSTFAMHLVSGQMRHYLRDRGHLIRQPAWLQELNARAARAAEELEAKLGRTPTNAELATALNVTEESVEELMAARQAAHLLRLEAPSDNGDDEFLDVDPEKFRSKAYQTLALPLEDRIVLEETLQRLKELERDVLYGFFFQEFNQSEIARTLGISCNYAGHLLRNGLKHMKERLPTERFGGQQPAASGDDVLDPQTGVYHSEYFQHRLAEEVCRAFRYRQPMAICLLRLPDGCPDTGLRAAAAVLRDRTRKQDVVGRTGAYEFGLLLPNTGPIASSVAERMAAAVRVTVDRPVAAGAAIFADDGKTANVLLRVAAERCAANGSGSVPQPSVQVPR
jgi:RNA polymerase sigma-B factor